MAKSCLRALLADDPVDLVDREIINDSVETYFVNRTLRDIPQLAGEKWYY